MVIQQNTPAVDGFGSAVPHWQDLVTAMASISTQGGREFYQAKQVNAELTHEIKMHWQRGIRPDQRVKFWDAAEGVYRYFDIRCCEFGPDARCDFVACP